MRHHGCLAAGQRVIHDSQRAPQRVYGRGESPASGAHQGRAVFNGPEDGLRVMQMFDDGPVASREQEQVGPRPAGWPNEGRKIHVVGDGRGQAPER